MGTTGKHVAGLCPWCIGSRNIAVLPHLLMKGLLGDPTRTGLCCKAGQWTGTWHPFYCGATTPFVAPTSLPLLAACTSGLFLLEGALCSALGCSAAVWDKARASLAFSKYCSHTLITHQGQERSAQEADILLTGGTC